MKENKALFFILILISQLTLAQDISSTDLNVEGAIKSIIEISYVGKLTTNEYEKSRKGWETSWKMDSKTEFDVKGNKVKKTYYDSNSKVVRTDQYSYENDKLIESIVLHHTRNYKYDSSGKLISMIEKNRQPNQINASNANIQNKEKISVYNYEYNSKNMLIRKIELDSNGSKIGETRYDYNESGRLTKEKTIFEDYEEWFKYTYDSSGNLLTKEWHDSDEGILEKANYVYENLIKTHEYWENYAEGLLEGKISYSFEKGNEKRIVETDDSGNIDATWDYQYEFDSKGNWTEQVLVFNNEKIFIVERKLEYY